MYCTFIYRAVLKCSQFVTRKEQLYLCLSM